MQRTSSPIFIRLMMVITLLSLAALACNLPIAGLGSATATPVPTNTLAPTVKPATATMASTQKPTTPPATVPPTQPAATAAKSATPAPTQKPASGYRGFVVFDNGNFLAYDINGKALDFKRPASGSTYLGENEAQVVGSDVFYLNQDEGVIYKLDASGRAKLSFIPKAVGTRFAVSQDGKQIAWSTSDWSGSAPSSAVWAANIDGSNARKAVVLDAKDNPNFLALYPYRWTSTGKLLYVTQPTGIGGYILFGGFASLGQFDPATNKSSDLVGFEKGSSMCLDGANADVSLVSAHCSGGKQGMFIRNIASGKITTIPAITGQNVAGSGVFSPSGKWLAYATARNSPENESGRGAIVPVDGSAAPVEVITAVGGYYTAAAWWDDETVLFEGYIGDKTGIYTATRFGSTGKPLVNGAFVGFLK